MPPIPLDTARQIASRLGYDEINFNKQSRVISFRKEGTRINVYYITGTVATCIDHPRQGKTQFVCRDRSPEDLDTIFRNPRTHTGGVGYYLTYQGSRVLWTCTQPYGGRTQCDDAQRWRYVQAATGFCNPQQAAHIAACCELWNQLRFAPGISTKQPCDSHFSPRPEDKAKVNPFCPTNGCGQSCDQDRAGSVCSLGRVICYLALKTDIETLIPILFYFGSKDDASMTDGDDSDPFHAVPFEAIVDCTCVEGIQYRTTHVQQIQKLHRQLLSFQKPIRRELIYFFFKQLLQAYDLVLRGQEREPFKFDGGAQHLSNAVLRANHDYGEMMYPQEDN